MICTQLDNEEHDEDCVEERFKLAGVKFDRDGEEDRKALGMRTAVSIFEMNQKWNQIDPRRKQFFNIFII